jgi:CRISPR-associated protein Cst1
MNIEHKHKHLRYTGHPFVDIGVATIAVIASYHHKRAVAPEDVTYDDMLLVANSLSTYYTQETYKPVQNYISVIFTNSHFVQPSKSVEDKREYATEVLYAFTDDMVPLADGSRCTFFPEKPAVMHATRQHIPLLNGANISNFSPMGGRGIPVSGEALLAIHAMPLGCLKCGNLLLLHQLRYLKDTSVDLNFEFARLAWDYNQKGIDIAGQGGKMPSYSRPRTRYVDSLLTIHDEIRNENLDPLGNLNLTGYYFTNYGPNPDMEILKLDSTVLRFIDAAKHEANTAWKWIQKKGWVVPRGEEDTSIPEHRLQWRNRFYEALFDLPHNAQDFVLRYLSSKDSSYSEHQWKLIEVFLREVMQMEQERIDTYRKLGERLAHFMIEYDMTDGFYYKIAKADKYSNLRAAIKSAATKVYKAGSSNPLINYDEFILAFEHPSLGYSQWRLGRDLIALKMLEVLHQHRGKFEIGDDLDEDFPEENIDD